MFLMLEVFNSLGSPKPPELIDLNSKISDGHSNNVVVLKTLPRSLTESRVWKCLCGSYAITSFGKTPILFFFPFWQSHVPLSPINSPFLLPVVSCCTELHMAMHSSGAW